MSDCCTPKGYRQIFSEKNAGGVAKRYVPAESALRDALLAVELARLTGWSEPDLSDVFYLALLYHIGCTGALGPAETW